VIAPHRGTQNGSRIGFEVKETGGFGYRAGTLAPSVESLVLSQVRRLLRSPELVARTISAVRREGEAEDALLEESEVIEVLSALEPVWDELYPAEQARILRLLIERIDVAPDGISVTLHAAGIRSLVAELADQEAPALAESEPLLEAAE
jgi:hypothetical protein